MPYPNRAQWIIIWLGVLAFITRMNAAFFPALGGYNSWGTWLWPQVSALDPQFHSYRFVASIVIVFVALFWQFSKPVRLRSPILIPIVFALICIGWYALGRYEHSRYLRSPDAFMESQR